MITARIASLVFIKIGHNESDQVGDDMKKWHLLFGLIIVWLCVYGCAFDSQGPWRNAKANAEAALAEKTRHDNEVYRSYEERNTLEGYREFVEKYPDNLNVAEAQKKIERLEYDTCEEPACLREFISKYPESPRAVEARERLSTLTVKDLDRDMQKQYGFDLLLYRLNWRNLKKELITSDKEQLASFDESFSMIDHTGKTFFNTCLSFSLSTNIPDFTSPDVVNQFFDEVLSPQLDYLQVKFKQKDKIDGFSFEILLPPFSSSVSALKFYFSTDQVKHFFKGSLSKEALFKTSLIRIETPSLFKASAEGQTPIALMWRSEEDGTAKGGEFRRASIPPFSLKYPKLWFATKPTGDLIFNAADVKYYPNMQIRAFKTRDSMKDELQRITFSESTANAVQEFIEQTQKVAGKPRLEYIKSAGTQNGYPVYEFLLTWRLFISVHILPHGLPTLPYMSTFGRIIFTNDHTIILTGTVMGLALYGQMGGSYVSELKTIFNSLDLSKENLPPGTDTVAAPASKPAPSVIDKIIPSTQEAKPPSLPLVLIPLSEINVSIDGQRIAIKTPGFAFSPPQEWGIRKAEDHLYLSSDATSSLPSMKIMLSKITGDERAYLEETADRYTQSLKKAEGSRFDFIYNIPLNIHEKHQAFEFEIRYKPQGENKNTTSPRTVYGNVIAKDGYAIILAAETEGEIDTFKTLFETIDLKRK